MQHEDSQSSTTASNAVFISLRSRRWNERNPAASLEELHQGFLLYNTPPLNESPAEEPALEPLNSQDVQTVLKSRTFPFISASQIFSQNCITSELGATRPIITCLLPTYELFSNLLIKPPLQQNRVGPGASSLQAAGIRYNNETLPRLLIIVFINLLGW